MNIKKKTLLPSALSCLDLNLVEKAVLRYAELYKSALWNKELILPTQTTLKKNRGNTKNIRFQFHYRRFSEQRYSTLCYYYRLKEEGGGGLPCPFSKTGKKCPGFRENC